MLFPSPEFIYFFLPLSVLAWWSLQRAGRSNEAQWLIVFCSIFFYGWWNVSYVPLMIGNALVNFYLGLYIFKTSSRRCLVAGLIYNIGMLAYFKYVDFFIDNWNYIANTQFQALRLVLPLGISFFTFQVIAYLVDCYMGRVHDFSLRRFAFSISFYPHLIAGPILHYSDVMPQLHGRVIFCARQFSQGLLLFVIGLFKKGVIADRLAEIVDPLFATQELLRFFESWISAVGYGLQIYFDFSGYSDMAIGIGLMFGIILPHNFNSPYKSNSVAEFWKRWHITLSRFLRDYLYISLGGNRSGFARGALAAAVTMIIGGLWHGASWTFVLWGLLHGLFICVYRVWVRLGGRMNDVLAIAFTFISVTAAWVIFRADSIERAISMWKGMLGLNGFAVPYAMSGVCLSCSQTALFTGFELVQGGILLVVCFSYANAYDTVQRIEPCLRNVGYFVLLLFASLWLSGSHESFIYWQF